MVGVMDILAMIHTGWKPVPRALKSNFSLV